MQNEFFLRLKDSYHTQIVFKYFLIIALSDLNLTNAKDAIIETSHLICSANESTGFYMMITLAFNELMISLKFH